MNRILLTLPLILAACAPQITCERVTDLYGCGPHSVSDAERGFTAPERERETPHEEPDREPNRETDPDGHREWQGRQ